MDVGTAGIGHRSFQYQRINAEPSGSNIELSLCPPEEPSVIYHAPQNFQPFQSNILPCEDMSDRNPHLATISGNLGGWTELGDCIEMGRLAPDEEPLCNPNHSDSPGSTREPLSLELFVTGVVLQIVCSLLAVSACYMGAAHIGTCPANEGAPMLVYITGIAGLFLIGCHFAYLLACHFKHDYIPNLKRGVVTFQVITSILLMSEMILFYSMSPSFENSENYCDVIFYYFTFYMNVGACFVIFLSVLFTHCL